MNNPFTKPNPLWMIDALWSGGDLPGTHELLQIRNINYYTIKQYDFKNDGYRFLHGVALAWHEDELLASFGHNRGAENTVTEEARFVKSTDGGKTWSRISNIDSAPASGCAVSHGVFLSVAGTLFAYHGAYHGVMEQVHTLGYRWDDKLDRWEFCGMMARNGFWPIEPPVRLDNGSWIMSGLCVRGDCSAGGKHPPAVAISNGDNVLEWEVIEIPADVPGDVWGESGIYVSGSLVVNIARYGGLPRSAEECRALFSWSNDYGKTWKPALVSNLEMATTKPCCGTLSTGQHYLIGTTFKGCENNRAPLTIALTKKGELSFSSIFAIRRAECSVGTVESHPEAKLSYPCAVEREGFLYVGYSNDGGGEGRIGKGRELWNNNSAELAVIPISSLV
jgi:hypothetical protein